MFKGARHSIARARAALKYIILALSGHMDDILAKYKVSLLWFFSNPFELLLFFGKTFELLFGAVLFYFFE